MHTGLDLATKFCGGDGAINPQSPLQKKSKKRFHIAISPHRIHVHTTPSSPEHIMSRVIQLLSHNNHLVALTDTGEIYHTYVINDPEWNRINGPVHCPPRFSLPEEYEQTIPQSSPRRPTSIGPDGNYIPTVNANHYLY